MTDRDELPPEGKLPLPSPRSPGHLDDSILAYARENAPRKRAALQPAWMAGVATAGIVALALFISEPQEQIPSLGKAVQESKIEEKESPPATSQNQPSAAQPASVAAKAKSARIAAPAEAPIAREELLRAEYDSADMASGADLYLEDEAAPTASSRYKTGISPGGSRAEEVASPAASEAATVDIAELRLQLRLYAEQLQGGDVDGARNAYRDMRQKCVNCDLPDTLEAALETYLKY